MAVRDTSGNFDIPLSASVKPCKCGGKARFGRCCGAWVCDRCGSHLGLTRCYCGWSASGGDGRAELVEMGEMIDDEGMGGDAELDRGVS